MYLLPEICYLEKSIPGRYENKTTENCSSSICSFPSLSFIPRPAEADAPHCTLRGLFDDLWSVPRYLCSGSVWRTLALSDPQWAPSRIEESQDQILQSLTPQWGTKIDALLVIWWQRSSSVWAGFPEALKEGAAARGSHQNLTTTNTYPSAEQCRTHPFKPPWL